MQLQSRYSTGTLFIEPFLLLILTTPKPLPLAPRQNLYYYILGQDIEWGDRPTLPPSRFPPTFVPSFSLAPLHWDISILLDVLGVDKKKIIEKAKRLDIILDGYGGNSSGKG